MSTDDVKDPAAEIARLRGLLDQAREAAMDALATAVAAHSLLVRGKKDIRKHVASNAMFDQMLVDYERSIDRARTVLAAINAEQGAGDAG